MLPSTAVPAGPLSNQELFETFCRAGFPGKVATTMTAIALRESGGIPTAHNGNAQTGDNSYGLTQINLMDAGVAKLMQANGLTPELLLTADGNAKGAFLLWGGHNSNLNLAWYINRAVSYQQRYEQHLPAAQAAALASALGI